MQGAVGHVCKVRSHYLSACVHVCGYGGWVRAWVCASEFVRGLHPTARTGCRRPRRGCPAWLSVQRPIRWCVVVVCVSEASCLHAFLLKSEKLILQLVNTSTGPCLPLAQIPPAESSALLLLSLLQTAPSICRHAYALTVLPVVCVILNAAALCACSYISSGSGAPPFFFLRTSQPASSLWWRKQKSQLQLPRRPN